MPPQSTDPTVIVFALLLLFVGAAIVLWKVMSNSSSSSGPLAKKAKRSVVLEKVFERRDAIMEGQVDEMLDEMGKSLAPAVTFTVQPAAAKPTGPPAAPAA